MSFALAVVVANLASICCVLGAIFLAHHDKSGWGWFLVLSLILSHSVKSGRKESNEN